MMLYPNQVYNSEFEKHARQRYPLEWLAYLGQPMLYDGMLYVVRKPHNEMSQPEYRTWVTGVRVA